MEKIKGDQVSFTQECVQGEIVTLYWTGYESGEDESGVWSTNLQDAGIHEGGMFNEKFVPSARVKVTRGIVALVTESKGCKSNGDC